VKPVQGINLHHFPFSADQPEERFFVYQLVEGKQKKICSNDMTRGFRQ
jgi:hypothetical protein